MRPVVVIVPNDRESAAILAGNRDWGRLQETAEHLMLRCLDRPVLAALAAHSKGAELLPPPWRHSTVAGPRLRAMLALNQAGSGLAVGATLGEMVAQLVPGDPWEE